VRSGVAVPQNHLDHTETIDNRHGHLIAPSLTVGERGLRKIQRDAGSQRLVGHQCFFGATEEISDLEGSLFSFRKQIEFEAPRGTYFCSLSSRTVVYKGLVTPDQLPAFYADLADPGFATSFAMFHQRYSTNTQPSWALAQPFRFVAHNGEINTISANRRWVHAKRQALTECLQLPSHVRLLEDRVSDSASNRAVGTIACLNARSFNSSAVERFTSRSTPR